MSILSSAEIRPITKKCISDVANLEKDEEDLRESIKRAVKHGRFIGSEWCGINSNVWTDAYNFREDAWLEAAHKEMECDLYVKFCVGKTGVVVMVISFHPPRQRN